MIIVQENDMKNNHKRIAPLAIGMAVLLVFTIVFDALALTKFDNIFEKFFGKSETSLRGDTLNADTGYYKSDFSSPKELYEYERPVHTLDTFTEEQYEVFLSVLDEERKAAMVSNLLVVLCGNRDAQPIVNSGSLY